MSAVIWSAKFVAGVATGILADNLYNKAKKKRSNQKTTKTTA